jgi:uncharacterized Rossmann fold enzyme
MMKWEDWKDDYLRIVERLNLNPDADRLATALLSSLLRDLDTKVLLGDLRERIEGQTIVVCGAGPSLKNHLRELDSSYKSDDLVYVAADGAVSALLRTNRKCDILVTDLDGDPSDIESATRTGALTIVHGHGDNMEALGHAVPSLGKVLGSTQVEPAPNVFLWGGFTDGDRACHIVAHYAPRHVILAGMDFGTRVGQWSKPGHSVHYEASARKQTKLKIAEELISGLKEKGALDFTLLT